MYQVWLQNNVRDTSCNKALPDCTISCQSRSNCFAIVQQQEQSNKLVPDRFMKELKLVQRMIKLLREYALMSQDRANKSESCPPSAKEKTNIIVIPVFSIKNSFLIPTSYGYTNTTYLNLNDTAKINPCQVDSADHQYG